VVLQVTSNIGTFYIFAPLSIGTMYACCSSSSSCCNLYSAIILRQCSDSTALLQAYEEAIPHSEEGTFQIQRLANNIPTVTQMMQTFNEVVSLLYSYQHLHPPTRVEYSFIE